MDKYEYRVKTEQMLEYMEQKAYEKAMEVADTIDWRRVKNATMLCEASDVYEQNEQYEKSRDILFLAYDRSPESRKTVYRLGILALKIGDVNEAMDCYEEFISMAPKDPNQYILRYKILKVQRAPVEQQIDALVDFKKSEYVEKWAYELAKLYHEAGMTTECLAECDDLILWFSEGRYVYQAMELKLKYKPLTPAQQDKYESMQAARGIRARKAAQVQPQMTIPEPIQQAAQAAAEAQATPIYGETQVMEPVADEDLDAAYDDAKTVRIDTDAIAGAIQTGIAEGTVSPEAAAEAVKTSGLQVEAPKVETPAFTPTRKTTKASKNITGQMRIEEILAGWEEKQKEVEEEIQEKKQEKESQETPVVKEESILPDDVRRLMESLEDGTEEDIPLEQEEVEEEIQEAFEDEPVENMGDTVRNLDVDAVLAEAEEHSEDDSEEDEFEDEFEEDDDSDEEEFEDDLEEEELEGDFDDSEIFGEEDSFEEDEDDFDSIPLAPEYDDDDSDEEEFEEDDDSDEEEFEEDDDFDEEEFEEDDDFDEEEFEEDDDFDEEEFEEDDDFDEEEFDEDDDFDEEEFEEDDDFDEEEFEEDDDFDEEEFEEDDDFDEEEFEEDDDFDEEEFEEDDDFDEEEFEEDDDFDEEEFEGDDDFDDEAFGEDDELDFPDEEGFFDDDDYQEYVEPAPARKKNLAKQRKQFEEEDEFFEDEVDDEAEMQVLSAETTTPSRKEVAKAVATGKTAKLPTAEIAAAVAAGGTIGQDTGFIVQARYDLEAQSEVGLRAGLTEDQKKLFSYFVPVRGMSEQLVDVLAQDAQCTNREGTSATGNLLIIGRKGSGKTVLAVDVVKAIQKNRKIKQGKVAIVTGDSLNKKRISDIIGKLYGGALIIEKASQMNEKTVTRLNKAMERDTGEMLIVLEEQRKPLDTLLASNMSFRKKFTSRLEVPIFINDELVTFGQTYAKENGYKIDEMGILALYSRIDALQREDHAVAVAEVKEIMDEAIGHVQKTGVKKFAKKIFGKSTDDADRIFLTEKDFNI